MKDQNSVNKLLLATTGSSILHYDKWSELRAYRGIGEANCKKWISNILPSELLTRSIKRAVDSIVTLSEAEIFYREFPCCISPPDYGDNWGRFANYIEINNRAIAEMQGGKCKNGLISAIKMLPAIPPSAKSWANCIILSQIFL
jgi:hypothetical protein